MSPIESAWYLLTILLRLERPVGFAELASYSSSVPDLFARHCRIPESPLLLTDDGFVTATNSAVAALVRFSSKAVALLNTPKSSPNPESPKLTPLSRTLDPAGPDLASCRTTLASATPPVQISPKKKAWLLLSVLLRLGHPARLPDLASFIAVGPDLASFIAVAPDLITRLCRIPGSPLLTVNGFLTVTNSAVTALIRFLSKSVALSVPRVAITAAGERRECSVTDSRKRKVPSGDDVAVPAAKKLLFMDNPEGIVLPSLGWSIPTEVASYVSRDQQVLENNVQLLSFANDFFEVENKKLLTAERAARVEVGRLKADLQARDSSLTAKDIELATEKKKADELRAKLDEVVTTAVSKADELRAMLDEVMTNVVSKAQGELVVMKFKAGPSNERDVEAEITSYQELSREVASVDAEHEDANPAEEQAKESDAIVSVIEKLHEEKVIYGDSEYTM